MYQIWMLVWPSWINPSGLSLVSIMYPIKMLVCPSCINLHSLISIMYCIQMLVCPSWINPFSPSILFKTLWFYSPALLRKSHTHFSTKTIGATHTTGSGLVHLHLLSGQDLNQKFDVIITPNMSSILSCESTHPVRQLKNMETWKM